MFYSLQDSFTKNFLRQIRSAFTLTASVVLGQNVSLMQQIDQGVQDMAPIFACMKENLSTLNYIETFISDALTSYSHLTNTTFETKALQPLIVS